MKRLFLVLIFAFAFTNLYSQYDPTVCDNGDETSWGNLQWMKLEPAIIPGCLADPDCTIEVEYFRRQRVDERYEYQIKNIKYYNCENCNISYEELFRKAYEMFLVFDRFELDLINPGDCNNQVIFSAAACWEETINYGPNGRTGLDLKSCNTECCAAEYIACVIQDEQGNKFIEAFRSVPISNVTENCIGNCKFISCDYVNPFFSNNPIDVEDMSGDLTGGSFGKITTNENEFDSFTIVPNPAKDKLSITIENELTGIIQLDFYNLRGNLLTTHQFNKNSYKLNKIINIESFNTGLINYKLTIEGRYISGSFIKE